MSTAAFRATYLTTKKVLGRAVMQVILEVPIEQEIETLNILGPQKRGEATWVAVARLQEPQE